MWKKSIESEERQKGQGRQGWRMNLSVFKLLFTKPASGCCGKETSFREFIFASCWDLCELETGRSCVDHVVSDLKAFAMVTLSSYRWYKSTASISMFGDTFFFSFAISLFDRNKFQRKKRACWMQIQGLHLHSYGSWCRTGNWHTRSVHIPHPPRRLPCGHWPHGNMKTEICWRSISIH